MLRHALFFAAALFLSACDTSKKCDVSNCTGCCSADGECQAGGSNVACGVGAAVCEVCGLGQSCQIGHCAPFTSGGTGGGSGSTGGGSATGGGAATGGGSAAGGGTATGGGTGTGGGSATGGGAATGGGTQTTCTTCPTGFSCVNGACAGGDLSALTLDVSTSSLELQLLANGQPLVSPTCSTNDWITSVALYSDTAATQLAAFGWIDTCDEADTTTTWWSNGVTLTPRIMGPGPLSLGVYGAADITVSGNTTRTIDLPIHVITGHLSANGTPITCSGGGFLGSIAFSDGVTRVNGPVACSGGTSLYELRVPEGVWRVEVLGNSESPLPDLPVTVSTNATVGPATSTIDFNAVFTNLAFNVQLNGAVPTCTSGSESMDVYFRAQGGQLQGDIPLTCGSSFGTTLRGNPGTYDVMLQNYSASGFPQGTLHRTMTLTSSSTLNVQAVRRSGTVTINGAPLSGCGSSDAIDYYPTNGPEDFKLPITCGATTTFDGWLPVGSYAEFLDSTAAQIPADSTYWRETTVNGANTNVAFTLTTFDVTLDALANGAALPTNCTEGNVLTYSLRPTASGGVQLYSEVPCQAASTAQTLTLFAGTSTLTVNGGSSTPFATAKKTLTVSSNTTSVTDSVTRRVDGTIRVNGSTACTAGQTGTISFWNDAAGVGKTTLVSCQSGTLRFVNWVSPGRWRITVSGKSGLPSNETVLVEALDVP